jgi:hypothetical protein
MYIGSKVAATFTWVVDGVLTDPTTVVVLVRTPAGVETTYTYGSSTELTKVSAGVYKLTLTLNQPETWWFRAKGTGAAEANTEISQYVSPSHFTTP